MVAMYNSKPQGASDQVVKTFDIAKVTTKEPTNIVGIRAPKNQAWGDVSDSQKSPQQYYE